MITEFRCERRVWGDCIEMVVFQRDNQGNVFAGLPITMEKIDPHSMNVNSTIKLNHSEAQFLIDQLWSCGLRPSEGTGSAGALAATEHHLKDMQKIAFMLIEK